MFGLDIVCLLLEEPERPLDGKFFMSFMFFEMLNAVHLWFKTVERNYSIAQSENLNDVLTSSDRYCTWRIPDLRLTLVLHSDVTIQMLGYRFHVRVEIEIFVWFLWPLPCEQWIGFPKNLSRNEIDLRSLSLIVNEPKELRTASDLLIPFHSSSNFLCLVPV